MNHFLRLTLLAALLASPAAFTGCSSSKTTNTSTGTVGQHLIDLDRAYKDGVITKEQYDKMKKEIIRKHD